MAVLVDLALGIIPAYAGSTSFALTMPSPTWDHPRVCGEHQSAFAAHLWWQGSSPRMRGAPLGYDQSNRWDRIIPAYAGST